MTIKEIAKLAGVSTATVSYVINDSAPVKEETKEKVRTIIKNTGYTANSIAKSLRVNRTKTLGIIVEDMKSEQISTILDGIYEYSQLHGYKTLISNLRLQSKENTFYHNNKSNIELDNCITSLESMQVDGIIYIGSYNDSVDVTPKSLKPIVFCNCSLHNTNATTISYSNRHSAYYLTKELIRLGHHRISIITGDMYCSSSNQRYQGYLDALSEFHINNYEDYVVSGDWKFIKAKEVALELLTLPVPPTAIFAMNDAMAIGTYEAAHELGLSIPNDISIVGFHSSKSTKYIYPTMSSLSLPLKDMGYQSCEELLKLVQGESITPTPLNLPCHIRLRSSTMIQREKLAMNYS